MDYSLAPTRSNLMKIKDDLAFSRLGYELLDQKRTILVSELLTLVDQAINYENRVENALSDARSSLQDAIMHMGRLKVANLSGAINIDSEIEIKKRKVMGVTLPNVETTFSGSGPFFSPEGTSMLSEITLYKFSQALSLMGELAELKVSIMKLAEEVKRTIHKVNSLEKIVIPEEEEKVRYITERIDESERESFILMKSVKDKLEKIGGDDE